MASEPIVRTIYTDPTTNGLVRQGPTSHSESLVDQERYAQPIERVHGSGLHDWGIAEGLAIAATLNSPGIRVLPGIGIDVTGKHLSLAEGGKAEVGPNANNPNVAPTLVSVLATGAVLPTTNLTGTFFVSVTWRETFDVDLWNSSIQTVYQMLHTPWLRLELAANVTDATDDGSRVILGSVTLAAGNVTALTHERRREVGMPAGSIKFFRAQTTSGAPNPKAENTQTAEIRARAAGGLEVKVPGATDQIEFSRDGGNISKVAFVADAIVGRTGSIETVVIDTVHGNITLGAQGVEGDVVVNDAHNRRVFVVDGSNASTTVGAAGNEGDIRVMDAAGQPSMRVDGATGTTFSKRLGPVGSDTIDVDAQLKVHGDVRILDAAGQQSLRLDRATGDVIFRGALRDPAGSHSGIGHGLLKNLPDLCNGAYTQLHKHSNSGNASIARVRSLFTNGNSPVDTVDIEFSSPRQMTAYAALSFVDPRDPFDRADLVALEIYRIDDQDFRGSGWIWGGDHLGNNGDDGNCRYPIFVGVASKVTFRLRSFVNVDAAAVCIVFPEFLWP